MQNLNYDTDEPIYKEERDSQTQRTDWLPRGSWGQGGKNFGISKRKPAYVRERNHEVFRNGIRNCVSHRIINPNGKECEKGCMYV